MYRTSRIHVQGRYICRLVVRSQYEFNNFWSSSCSQFDSNADDFEAALQLDLKNHVLEGLAANDNALVGKVLDADLKLNAQGLAHWWKRQQNA